MDAVLLARIQFGFTIGFHYLFPPISIGLGVILVIMESIYLRTRNPVYEQMTRFWVRIFALVFAMGVATGIVMEFMFGTNWATYSRFVGDIFGSALAAEGIFAFFLESGFLAVLVFGWDKVKPRTHFIATIMVSLGSIMSAVWIIIANSWQQTPAGYKIVGDGFARRAIVSDFWGMIFNPSTFERLSHTLSAALLTGSFLVISVSAYYLLKKRHITIAKTSIKISIIVALIASGTQLLTGHSSAVMIEKFQPAKLAAFEGHYDSSAVAPLWLFGWVNEKEQKVEYGLKIPAMLSLLAKGSIDSSITGLNSIHKENRPPVNAVFQSYHIMIAVGVLMILIAILSVYYWYKNTLWEKKWFLILLVFSVFLPQIGNQSGWYSAEAGRQPWIVYNLMRTSEAVSKSVSSGQILFSLISFVFIYLLLFVLFIFLLDRKIKHGPEDTEIESEYSKQSNLVTH